MLWSSLYTLFAAHPMTLADAGGPLWLLPAIDVNPNILFYIGPIPVTNTLINAWVSMAITLGILIPATRKMSIIPKGLQNLVEWFADLLLGFCSDVAGPVWGRRFLPFISSIFLFILFANWTEIIPGLDAIGTPTPGAHPVAGIFLIGSSSNKLIPWIRPASSDLNFTLALALISVIVTQIYGFRILGPQAHLGKYLTLKDPISFFVGILEIVAEFARIISFSFRLFGNVFAGDVLLIVLGTLIPGLGATVFYPLELFVGFIQAFVFSALTLVFLSLATTGHDHGDEHAVQSAH